MLIQGMPKCFQTKYDHCTIAQLLGRSLNLAPHHATAHAFAGKNAVSIKRLTSRTRLPAMHEPMHIKVNPLVVRAEGCSLKDASGNSQAA